MSSSIHHHPDSATLMSYAAATLPESLCAIVAAHVSMCPHCRAEASDMELLGAAVMLAAPARDRKSAVSLPPRPVDRLVDKAHYLAPRDRDGLPGPIAAAYGLSFDTIPWKRLGPGVWHHRLALREETAGDLRLLRIAPGRMMPDHGHGGAELTLVLQGSYSDVTGQYRRGDVQDVDEDIEHQPVVSDDGACVCLIASEHPARFKSLVGRLLQPWTGL